MARSEERLSALQFCRIKTVSDKALQTGLHQGTKVRDLGLDIVSARYCHDVQIADLAEYLLYPIVGDLRIGRHRQIFLWTPLPELRDVLEFGDSLVDQLSVRFLDLEYVDIVYRAVVFVEAERSARRFEFYASHHRIQILGVGYIALHLLDRFRNHASS